MVDVDAYSWGRAVEKAIMQKKGYSQDEVAYHLAVMDARHEMRKRLVVTKFFLRRLRAFSYVRALLHYWEVYEDCYVWTAEQEAYERYMEEPELPDNVIPFPGHYGSYT